MRVAARAAAPTGRHRRPEMQRFVESSRRMATALESRPPRTDSQRDPGDALIDLLGFVAQVSAFRPPRPPEPLRFPPLGRLRAAREAESLTSAGQFGSLVPKIVSLHEMLDSAGVPHQFGGAIALAWYRNPRATTDIDVNLTLPPEAAEPILELMARLGVTVGPGDRATIALDGQARLDWDGSYLDVFFATTGPAPRNGRMRPHGPLGPVDIPILAPEHLIVCKAIFDRPKDWLDIEEMLRWGTEVDAARTLHWVGDFLGPDAEQYTRLAGLLSTGAAGHPISSTR